ncbi:thiol reductant ABC exporter subunit CydD [Aliidiomarina iranensis]|uniref:Thiol reductant ABC exporter subunit CydD n=1 Tax=Aliidiomarina iranensis TaxID=1434071 RepID=A0A432VZR5_9GAMM|nr:ABC transporter transmembrane domain-containing protein [Aliidiomarina iranensis]RUO22232.1 thiol reductant ABC exporter subunit CydD [Aliidiomarina iranensis]
MATTKPEKPFAAEKRYLARIGAATGRSLFWAKLYGSLQAIALIVQMGLFAWLVYAALQGETVATLMPFALSAIAAIAVRSIANWQYQRWALKASDSAQDAARYNLLQFWQQQMQNFSWQRMGDASAANDLVEPVNSLAGYYSRFLPQIWLATWQPLLILAVVFYLDWLAGLFLLLSAPLIPVFMALVGMGAERIHQKQAVAVQRIASLFIDRVRNLTLLFLMQKLPMAEKQVAVASDEYRALNMRTLKIAFLSSAVLEFFAAIAIAAIAIYIGFSLLGYYEVGPGAELTLFSGLFILLLAPEFFQPIRLLSQFYHDRAAALGAATILAPQTCAADRENSAASLKCAASPNNTANKDVSEAAQEQPEYPDTNLVHTQACQFQYESRNQTIFIPELNLQVGQTLLLQGPSGAGKSTVLQLLAGLLPWPKEADARALNSVAYLPQSPWIIYGSIADNLRLFTPDASSTALHKAMHDMGLAPLIQRLPHGLDTQIGESGAGISGGEAKRLTFARWLVAIETGFTPKLMLLDEPTAALDDTSAQYIVATVKRLRKQGISMVIASHSDDFTALADRTVLFEKFAEPDETAKSFDTEESSRAPARINAGEQNEK